MFSHGNIHKVLGHLLMGERTTKLIIFW
jgi:hypothetical protein